MTVIWIYLTLILVALARLYWVYRINLDALNITFLRAKKRLENGDGYANAYDQFFRQQQSLWRMFFALHKWNVYAFYPFLLRRQG